MFGRTGFFFALLLGVVLHSNTVQAFSNMSRVKHVVMFTLQDDVSEEKVQGMLLNSRCVCVCGWVGGCEIHPTRLVS